MSRYSTLCYMVRKKEWGRMRVDCKAREFTYISIPPRRSGGPTHQLPIPKCRGLTSLFFLFPLPYRHTQRKRKIAHEKHRPPHTRKRSTGCCTQLSGTCQGSRASCTSRSPSSRQCLPPHRINGQNIPTYLRADLSGAVRLCGCEQQTNQGTTGRQHARSPELTPHTRDNWGRESREARIM